MSQRDITTSSNKKKKTPSHPLLMMESAAASSSALIFSNPFELIKTRLQLQGELQKVGQATIVYKGMLHGVYRVCSDEGIFALYQGLGSAIVHQIVMNGIRFGLYNPVKKFFSSFFEEAKTPLEQVPINIASAFSVGLFGSWVASPFFLMKTRLQSRNASNQTTKVGQQHEYSGMIDGLKKMYLYEGGIRGFWSGAVSCMARTAVGSAAQLPMYDFVKQTGMQKYGYDAHDVRLHIFCSLCAAMNIVIFMCPFDTLNVRMFNNVKNSSGAHYSNNIFVALQQILKVEGFAGLYKGWNALWFRTAPHSLFTFLFLEQIQKHRGETTEKMLPFLYATD